MTALPLLGYLTFIAAALAALVVWRALWRRGAASRRPLLLLASVLGSCPTLYAAAVWAGWLPESYLRFERPWLAPLGMLAILWTSWRLLALRRRWGRWRGHLSDALSGATVILLGLAALDVAWGTPLDRLTVVVLVDRSRSIDLVPNAPRSIDRALARAETFMRDDDMLARVVFGAQAATEQPPRHKRDPATAQHVNIGRDSSNIAAGIRRALAEVPADSAARIVLISDGVATRGDVLAAAAAAHAAMIPIDVLALQQQSGADLRLVDVRLPQRSRQRETMPLVVVVSSPEKTDIEVRIKRDGRLWRRLHARVKKGQDVLRLHEPAEAPGLHRYDVEISAMDPRVDSNAEDNAQTAFVRVVGPALALVIDADDAKTAFMAGALRAAGFGVDSGGPGAFPPQIGDLARYDLLIFGDVPARHLSPSQLEAIGTYVRDLGGGLILMGGDGSMGPGGYAKTAVEEVSPLSFDLKQQRRRASLAEVIAVDISGSMAMTVNGKTKLALANEAAARSANLLGPGDRLGVLHVDTTARWTVPLAPITNKAALSKAIFAVGPGGGGIYVDVALAQAYARLDGSAVNLKHVLLFADGDDAENIRADVVSDTAAAARRGITTSCVALGRGNDLAALEQLAQLGGGRFYIVEDASRLPAVFAEETVLASRAALVEEPFEVTASGRHPATDGIDFAAAPTLDGYVVTIKKPRSSVLLTGPDNDPVLAVWAAGVGKSAAFTSDMKNRWGSRWTRWSGAARLLSQMARFVARNDDDAKVRLQAHAAAGQLHLRATVVDDDGRLQSFRRLSARVVGPDGFSRTLPLEATGAGSYTASLPLPHAGAFIVAALDRDAPAGEKVVATTGAALSAGEEMQPTGTDHALLSRIVELSGGKTRSDLKQIFHDRVSKRFAYRDITQWLLVAAACGLLLMVAVRRLALPLDRLRRLSATIRSWRRAAPAPALADARSRPAATLHQLLKRRAQTPTTDTPARAGSSTDAPPRPTAAGATPANHAPLTAVAPRRPRTRAASEPPATVSARPPRPTTKAAPDGHDDARSAAEKLLARRRQRRDE